MADPMDQPDRSVKPTPPDKGRASSGKISNSLVALSSAAVLTVYAAGYLRTRSAAERFAVEAADLRTAGPFAGAAAATAAPPREFVDGVKAAETAPTIPSAPGPKSETSAHPGSAASPEPSPAPIADSTGAESPKEPAGQLGTPTEEPTAPSPAAQTTNAAPADVDTKAAEPPAPPPAARQAQYKDGTYFGWGYSRHGDIQASVLVQDGRIVAAQITQCLTRYSCDVIDTLPSQVIGRQNAFVDLISGATESANAFSNAIYRALAMAK